jgi:hypothetical protein
LYYFYPKKYHSTSGHVTHLAKSLHNSHPINKN